jgi:hypothetical protein
LKVTWPPTLTLETAEQLLREFGGFEWLLTGKIAWSAQEVAQGLESMGIGIAYETVLQHIKELPDTLRVGGFSIRASRRSLILWFAGQRMDQLSG